MRAERTWGEGARTGDRRWDSGCDHCKTRHASVSPKCVSDGEVNILVLSSGWETHLLVQCPQSLPPREQPPR